MEIRHSHCLGRETAYERLCSIMEEFAAKYQAVKVKSAEWNPEKDHLDFLLSRNGFSIEGDLYLTDSEVRLEADVPWLLRPFQAEVELAIREELEKRLS